jgi:hypothetical protein
LPNGDSPLLDTTYTPLSPGSDGGLSTADYQPAPSPAFAGTTGGVPTGDALASRLVQPQTFFGIKFSINTTAVDAQTGEPAPLPVIAVKNGKLSGRITAWNAQWNGLSFNQGAPKPNGTYAQVDNYPPALNASGTVAPSGTYDATTKRFVLDWQSLIVGGPFDRYSGRWHLEGTFVPAAS